MNKGFTFIELLVNIVIISIIIAVIITTAVDANERGKQYLHEQTELEYVIFTEPGENLTEVKDIDLW